MTPRQRLAALQRARVQHNIAAMQVAHAQRRANELSRLVFIHGAKRVAKALAAYPVLLDPDNLTDLDGPKETHS
ncbi:MAG: hypothetical protein JST91_26525 [Actinobacteria bacterium]|nr:hypothetical protein [Actinomycetota bacterium]